jgi:hypothetical protein
MTASAANVPLTFTETAKAAGLNFTHTSGAFGAKLLPETMGSGAAFLDYDGDGYPDIYIVNSRHWTDDEVKAYVNGSGRAYAGLVPADRKRERVTGRLYHNNGNGTFTDVTAGSGTDVEMYGMGATVGDFDNDGRLDLYVTAIGRNYLFRNLGGGRFEEVAEKLGVKDGGWSTSAAFVDYDKDGKLDLFVCHYVAWSAATDIYCTLDGQSKSYCTPESYDGQVSTLYHNDGSRFSDVSKKALIHEQPAMNDRKAKKLQGKSLGVAVCDVNGDGWPDLVIANDTEPNYLLQNNKDGTFTEVGIENGIALSEAGVARAAMGVSAGDIDRSGRESLLFGNFSNQMLGLYQNKGNGLFIDVAPQSEVGQASLQFLAFGVLLVDLDNDGLPDIFTANGHVENEINRIQRDITYAERPLLFLNTGNCRFREYGTKAGADMQKPVVGRGLAGADIDLDGDVDILMTVNNGPVCLYRNDGGNRNHSLRIELEGTRSPRCGIGAQIEVTAGGVLNRTAVRGGSSYCSMSELPVTVGLGSAAKAEKVVVKWPSGVTTELKDVAGDRIVRISEGSGLLSAKPLPGRR